MKIVATPVHVAIVGASGYSGEELVRLLLRHPQAELVAVTSRQYVGQTVAQVFPKYASEPRAKVVAWIDRRARQLGGKAVGASDHHFAHDRPRTE